MMDFKFCHCVVKYLPSLACLAMVGLCAVSFRYRLHCFRMDFRWELVVQDGQLEVYSRPGSGDSSVIWCTDGPADYPIYPHNWRGPYIQIRAWVVAMLPALLVIYLWPRERQSAAGHCRACNYNLTGNVSGVCSERGTAIAG